MESYIEVSFLNSYLICVLAYYTSAYFSLSKLRSPHFFLWLLLEQILHVALFSPHLYVLFYVYELFFYAYLFLHQYKKALMYIAIKYMLMATFFKFFGGGFHLFHYYVPSFINMYGIWLLMLALIFLLRAKWSAYLRVSDFMYTARIQGDTTFRVRAFLDTGNSVCVDGIPVLFLDASLHYHFKKMKCKRGYCSSVHGQDGINVYLCEVTIDRYKNRPYYICCDKTIQLEWDCKCLLNVEL